MQSKDKFITFLIESGATILDTTNEYEVVRFRTINGVSVVYTGRRGIKFTGESEEAHKQFKKHDIWQIKRRNQKEREALIRLISARDGMDCFYCGDLTIKGKNSSIEHLLSISHGGNNNPANLTICCRNCNEAVGNVTVFEKVLYRESVHKELNASSEENRNSDGK